MMMVTQGQRCMSLIATLKADFLSWQKLLATIFFKRNQSSDNRSHSFGAKFLLKKLSASDFSNERKSALRPTNRSFASLFAYIVTICVGQRIGNSPGAKVLNPSPNFVVSSSIMIKFGVLIEFDKFSPK